MRPVKYAEYKGVSFTSVRLFLFNLYFYDPSMTEEQAAKAISYVLPMQHNIDSPLQGGSEDTFIEYWIAFDDRNSQDYNWNGDDFRTGAQFIDNGVPQAPQGTGENNTWNKLATIDIRFVGSHAEVWAKAFHHLTKRQDVHSLAWGLCNANILDYVGGIRPQVIDYFSPANASIAFDLTFKLHYNESIGLNWQPLNLAVVGPGTIQVGGQIIQ